MSKQSNGQRHYHGFANFAGIGMGIAFYEQKWPSLIFAVIAILILLCLAWRTGDDAD